MVAIGIDFDSLERKLILMKKNTYILIGVAILLMFSPYSFSEEVTLDWAANTEPELLGYYIYYKPDTCCAPYQGTGADQGNSPIQVPLSQIADPGNPEFLISGLDDNRAYYFVISAYDGEEESGYSNEVKIKAPQIVSQPVPTYLSNNAVTIEWKTNEPGNSEARFGFSSAEWNGYPELKIADAEVTSHSLTLTGLLPGTIYHYRGGATNALGFGPDLEENDTNPSQDYDFMTASDAEQDTKSPQFLTQPYATSISDTRAAIEWETDETTNSVVMFGNTTSYGQTVSDDSNYTRFHRVDLTSLQSGTLYHVQVQSQDAAGNPPVSSADFTFTTSTTADTTIPVFTSPPTVTAKTDTTVTIEWTTNEPSNTKVRYGKESATWRTYPSKLEYFGVFMLNHSLTITDLTPETSYYFRAGTVDPSWNQAISSEYTFTTAKERDTTPPKITTTPTVVSKSDTTSTIVWDTDEPANSTIRYWEESWAEPRIWENYQYTKNTSVLTSQHAVTLTNLTGESRYFFMVGSSDADGNGPTTSFESSFVTEAGPDLDAPQIISPPTVTAKTNQTVTIEWVTDEPSNSIIQYGEN